MSTVIHVAVIVSLSVVVYFLGVEVWHWLRLLRKDIKWRIKK